MHVVYLKDNTPLKQLLHTSIETTYIPLNARTSTEIRKLVLSTKPDVVHTHLGHADFLGLWAVRGLALKTFCTMHNIWFKWNWKDKIIFEAYKILFRTVAYNCKIIAISNAVKEHVIHTLKVPAGRVNLIYNGIPSSVEIHARSLPQIKNELNIDENNFNILFIGRLEIQKSVETLLKAAQLLKPVIPNLKIILVGEGSLRENLEMLSFNLGLEEITEFKGVTLKPEHYFAACDIFVLPSVFEGMGIVLLEAFRSKIPVIASNTEGPAELIKDEFNGLLFTPLNYRQLAEKITRLYQDRLASRQIGENGYKFYKENFDIRDYASKLEKLYL